MMPEVSVLDVLLHGERVGTMTRVPGDRNLFAFNRAYVDNANRSTVSLSFKDSLGGLITELPPTQTRVAPFFANLLPEESLRTYLAARAGVNPKREFFLLWVLGRDLPGALTIRPADGEAWPPDAEREEGNAGVKETAKKALRFSLAGVQLKFSAVMKATGGLTIPAQGVGGSWIVKLPSQKFEGVPENEFAMMSLARKIGMDVPDMKLVPLDQIEGLPEGIGEIKGQALVIKRFDRSQDGPVHIEDFAQVFGVWPEDKYKKASYKNIASVIATEGEDRDVAEFIRRLVFNTLIGNADMHLKNWSLIYPDRRSARLSPAYDFVSTIAYIPDNYAALKYARTKRMDEFSRDELAYLAAKARLPEKLTLDAAAETVKRFREAWDKEKANLDIASSVRTVIDAHLAKVPLTQELAAAAT
jgi:serine/threonine-protein kinase HipA